MTEMEMASDAARQGREATLVLQLSRSLIEETYESLVNNAIAAYRGGHLTAERALVFVGKLDAIIGFREELESRVMVGEAASEALLAARLAPMV